MQLYICPTPIGNLGDMTYRAVETLQTVDIIACEDTRTTQKLLNHFGIKKRTYSYHDHNEQQATDLLIGWMKEGKTVALVSDAGMPGISDPGEVLIKACIAAEINYTVLPGASAMVTALVASQLRTSPFHFEGFLDRHKRLKRLEALKTIASTLVFYESPHRLLKTLKDLLAVFGDRQMTSGREISKKFETYRHETISQAILHFTETDPRGEFVLVVEGYTPIVKEMTLEDALDLVKERMQAGERLKECVKDISKTYGIDRQTLYKKASES